MPIYEQSFRHYDGPRTTRRMWWPVAWQTMRPMLKPKPLWLFASLGLLSVLGPIASFRPSVLFRFTRLLSTAFTTVVLPPPFGPATPI